MCYHWLYIFRSLAKFWLAHKASQNTTDEYKYTVIPHIEMINNSSKILFTKSLFWVSFDTFTWSTEELLNWSHGYKYHMILIFWIKSASFVLHEKPFWDEINNLFNKQRTLKFGYKTMPRGQPATISLNQMNI